jgi:hypothetical protein
MENVARTLGFIFGTMVGISILFIAATMYQNIEIVKTEVLSQSDDDPVASVQSQTPVVTEDGNIVFTGLPLERCDINRYNVSEIEQRSVVQCYPQDYTLYELGTNGEGNIDAYTLPIELEYMGVCYIADMQNRANGVGFTRDTVELGAGQYLLKIEGYIDIRSRNRLSFGIAGFYSIPGTEGVFPLKPIGFPVNGPYKAEWLIEINRRSTVQFTNYAFSNHGDLPEWGNIIMCNITLEKVDW